MTLLTPGSVLAVNQSGSAVTQASSGTASATTGTQAEQVILFVLEGIGQESLNSCSMPVLSRLVKEGSVTWSAAAVTRPRNEPSHDRLDRPPILISPLPEAVGVRVHLERRIGKVHPAFWPEIEGPSWLVPVQAGSVGVFV